jgi:hypothetical protein
MVVDLEDLGCSTGLRRDDFERIISSVQSNKKIIVDLLRNGSGSQEKMADDKNKPKLVPTLKLNLIKKEEPTNSQDTIPLTNFSQLNKTD